MDKTAWDDLNERHASLVDTVGTGLEALRASAAVPKASIIEACREDLQQAKASLDAENLSRDEALRDANARIERRRLEVERLERLITELEDNNHRVE